MSYVPDLGRSGLWTLDAPFTELIVPEVEYTVVAVRKLTDVIAAGADPFESLYAPFGIDEATYEADVSSGAVIVSLQSSNGDIVYVPSTYINGYPITSGMPYHVIGLGVKLGPMPTNVDVGILKTEVEELVRDRVGVDSEVKILVMSEVTNVSFQQHEIIEQTRLAAIAASETTRAKLLRTEGQLAEARAMIAQLEALILSMQTP